MPSNFERVQIPDELRGDRLTEEPADAASPGAAFWRSLFVLTMMVIGTAAMTVGLWWWVHPGAGLAIMGLSIFVTAVMIETGQSRE